MLVPDVLHELELGVWKAILLHLICMLASLGSDTVLIMNQRYKNIPTFGRSTIRRIRKNVSAMKNLAAWDYEGFLQVSMPVFEGLFPDHNKEILDLLFDLNSLHSFAKLRLHSDLSIKLLNNNTTELGKSLRTFQRHVSPNYDTKELSKEVDARQRQKAGKNTKQPDRKGKGKQKASDDNNGGTNVAPKPKPFNLSTYKIHVIGYYAKFIVRFGTTDGYSTQTGELEHGLFYLTTRLSSNNPIIT